MRLLRTTGTLLSAAVAALATSGCTFITGVHGTSRVTVTVAPDVIGINGQAQAIGTAFDGDTPLSGNSRYSVTYSSRDPSIATVDAARGLVLGKAYGSTYIVAENRGKSDSALITVRPVQAVQVIINGSKTPTYRVGAQNGISATAYDSSGRGIGDRPVTWTSRNPAVLTVSSIGAVAPLTVGSTWIVASIDNGPGTQPKLDSAQATVTLPPVYSIVVKPDNSNNNTPVVYVGQTLQFTATLVDSLLNSTTRPVTWSTSDNGRVLAISPTGLATGVAPLYGSTTTTVSATVDYVPNAPTPRTLATSVAVSVRSPVDSTRVLNGLQDITKLTVAKGATVGLTLVPIDVLRYTLTDRIFSVTSSNSAVIAVPAVPVSSNSTLQITGSAAGTTTITVQALDASNNPQGRPSTITITVQ